MLAKIGVWVGYDNAASERSIGDPVGVVALGQTPTTH